MSTTEKMNINNATVEDVANLPFMNKERARLVTDYIASNGPLENISQIDDIPGIGEKLSNLLEQHFTVGNSSGSSRGNNNSDDGDGRRNNGGNNRNQGGGGNHGNANK